MPHPKERSVPHGVVLLVSILVLWHALHCSAWAQVGRTIRGTVLYPDGSAAPRATVTATTICDHASYRLVKQETTADDGSFSIESFGEDCYRYRLSANKSGDFWLETGDAASTSPQGVFYSGPNGTYPTVDVLSTASPPAPVTIELGQRGGKVDLQVWDRATSRFIYAILSIDRRPVEGKKFGSEEIATGMDGSLDTLFLPPGDYVASVVQYQCKGKEFWAAMPPEFRLPQPRGPPEVEYRDRCAAHRE